MANTTVTDYEQTAAGTSSLPPSQNGLAPRQTQRPPRPSSGLCDIKSTQPQKLHVLIAANCERDVARAEALVVRFYGHPKIECRAIVNDLTVKLQHFAPAIQNTEGRDHAHEEDEGLLQERTAYAWGEWADLLVLAPVDGDTLAKMLYGITGSTILEVLRGWDVSKKIILVPGMTTAMWENPLTKKQLSKLRKKWNWVRVMSPILWHFDEKGPGKCFVGWDGFGELVEVVKNQAELMTIGHDVDIATAGAAQLSRSHKTETLLPPEIWTVIFEYVGDWEVAQSLAVYTTLPTPKEWEQREAPKDDLQKYMCELEWAILTQSIPKVIEKLNEAPKNILYISPLCVKLIIKFCLTPLLSHLETNHREVFWASFRGNLLPTKASAVYGRTAILEWWRTSASFLKKDYTAEAIDGASRSGFVHVLDWWRKSGLPLKYTEAALEQASGRGHILVLEWWKEASMHQGSYVLEPDTKPPMRRAHSNFLYDAPTTDVAPSEAELPPLRLKVGKAILTAAQNGQVTSVRWWDTSGIPYSHGESVARIASAYGHVDVLEEWKELKGDKFAMSYDSQVLVGPTKNGFVRVLEWWRRQTRGDGGDGDEEKRLKVEYKTCDIEEALEDSVRLAGGEGEDEVRKWWARNGLNLGVGTSEWMKLKTL